MSGGIFRPPPSRAQFDSQCGPKGAYLIGDAESIIEKILYLNAIPGGISRLNFQMNIAAIPHREMLRAIEIRDTRVAPLVRETNQIHASASPS